MLIIDRCVLVFLLSSTLTYDELDTISDTFGSSPLAETVTVLSYLAWTLEKLLEANNYFCKPSRDFSLGLLSFMVLVAISDLRIFFSYRR